ncbi:TRAP-T family transporter, fused small and large inner membrane subunits [uncultured delta proteobacterium]|uniref:TRAP-T family transporter, fused small and large inner membrane subunits n=1 Tax=uncultured delta proteobacterium TaxID=34034 RepID=A0A212JCJ6_9DELT|nr:TRAP-T family transporter, fused small and large inner membrane subunits [uncultured delta proteobacterium]
MIEHLLAALPAVIFSWHSILAMVLSTGAGIVIGALPGLSATMGVALLIPFTFGMDPLTALLAMAGMYNGAIYGGSIAAILLNIPGTPAAVCTTLDGYPMAKRGEGVLALQTAVICSTFGGAVSALSLMFVAPYLAALALGFGPAEYFWVAVLGLSTIASFLSGSTIKGLISGFIGLLVSTIGTDAITGVTRFDFGTTYLLDGVPQLVALIGLFSIPEVFSILERSGINQPKANINLAAAKGWDWVKDTAASWGIWIRSSVIGVIVGMLPGAGANIAAFISYNDARQRSKTPEKFGTGIIDGVKAAETANNAVTASALAPMLTFGVPGNAVAAVMIGGLMIHGLQPGPNLFVNEPTIVYGLMWGMFLTNFIMLFFGVLGSRLFAKCLLIPPTLMAAAIAVLSCVGTFSINNTMGDVYAMLVCGLVGVIMLRLRIPVAPAVLGLILGGMAEDQLRRALMLSDSVLDIFTRPISAVLVLLTLISLSVPVIKAYRKRRAGIVEEATGGGTDF